jgi:hypothetical protein
LVSGDDGDFMFGNLPPGRYQLSAKKVGFGSSRAATFELAAGQRLSLDVTLGADDRASSAVQNSNQGGFFRRFFKAYWNDWKGTSADTGPPPHRRGNPAPVEGPPFPFSDWPYGGSVVIGAPWTQSAPLMQAIWSGPRNGTKKDQFLFASDAIFFF